VPEQFRGTAIIVEGESNEEEAVMPDTSPSVPAEAPAAGPAPQYQGKRTRPLSSRLMISAAVGLSAVLLFIIVVARQSGLHLDNKILSRFRAGLIALVSLYLVFAHARDVMIIFGFAGRAIEDVQQQSAEKGKKAVEAMKTIDALFEEAQKAGQISETIVQTKTGNNRGHYGCSVIVLIAR